jgi:hypothetical protein
MLGVSRLENVPIRWHLTIEFAAMESCFQSNRSQTSLNGSSQDEKVSAVNNALRHVIFGVIS